MTVPCWWLIRDQKLPIKKYFRLGLFLGKFWSRQLIWYQSRNNWQDVSMKELKCDHFVVLIVKLCKILSDDKEYSGETSICSLFHRKSLENSKRVLNFYNFWIINKSRVIFEYKSHSNVVLKNGVLGLQKFNDYSSIHQIKSDKAETTYVWECG